jgi:hypothetical protein
MTDSVQNDFGQRTPTARSIHQCSLAYHQHEVTEPALFGVHAAAHFLSAGEPCEGFRGTLEGDCKWWPLRLMEDLWVSFLIGRVC